MTMKLVARFVISVLVALLSAAGLPRNSLAQISCIPRPPWDDKCESWTATFESSRQLPHAAGIEVDPRTGNSFIAGSLQASGGKDQDLVAAAYGPAGGDALWERILGRGRTIAGHGLVAMATALDPEMRTFYVLATDARISPGAFLTVALDTGSGAVKWKRRYRATVYGETSARDVAVDTKRHRVFVTGIMEGERTDGDFVTIGYKNNGQLMWARRYSAGSKRSYEIPEALTVAERRVFVTGISRSNIVVVAYGARGRRLWVARLGFDGAEPQGMGIAAVDENHAVAVTGANFDRATETSSYVTAAFARRNGRHLWTQKDPGPSGGIASSRAIAVAPDQKRLFVTGEMGTVGDDASSWGLTVAYDAQGNELWRSEYDSLDHDYEFGTAITATDTQVLVTFVSINFSTTPETGVIATVSYDAADGLTHWSARYSGSDEAAFAFSRDLAISNSNSAVHVLGEIDDEGLAIAAYEP